MSTLTVGTISEKVTDAGVAVDGVTLKDGGAVFTSAITATDNTVDLGASSTRFKDVYLSGGAFLGGTGSANKISDYEEGTFTPDVKNQSSSSTFSVRIGNYVKIGRLVLAHFYCDGGNTGTAGSNLVISGLPFSVDAGSGAVNIGNFTANGSGENNGGVHQNLEVTDGGSTQTGQKSFFSANLVYRTS